MTELRPRATQWPSARDAAVSPPERRPISSAGQHQAPISAGMLKTRVRKETTREPVSTDASAAEAGAGAGAGSAAASSAAPASSLVVPQLEHAASSRDAI